MTTMPNGGQAGIRPRDGLPPSAVAEPGNWPDGRLVYSESEIAVLRAAGLTDEEIDALPREGRERTMQEREISALKKWGIAVDEGGNILRDEDGRAQIAAPLVRHAPPLASPRPRLGFTHAGAGPETIWTRLHGQVPLLMQDSPAARDAIAHGAVLKPVRIMRDGVQLTVVRAEYPDSDRIPCKGSGGRPKGEKCPLCNRADVVGEDGNVERHYRPEPREIRDVRTDHTIRHTIDGRRVDKIVTTIGATGALPCLPSQVEEHLRRAGDDRRKCTRITGADPTAPVNEWEIVGKEVYRAHLGAGIFSRWGKVKKKKAEKAAADPARAPRRERTEEEKAQAARVRALQQQKAAIDLARGAETEKRLKSDEARIRAATEAAMSSPAPAAPRETATAEEIAERKAREAARKAAREAARKAAETPSAANGLIFSVKPGDRKIVGAPPSSSDLTEYRLQTEARRIAEARERAAADRPALCDARKAPPRAIVAF